MNRLLILLLLFVSQQNSFAAVYKCEHVGGKVEYQSSPCEKGREVTLKTAGSVVPTGTTSATPNTKTSPEQKKCVGKEMRIDFTSMPLKATLQVIADYSGSKLVVDPLVSGAGAFRYDCVPWDTVLQDIASKHHLVVKVENGTIYATKR